MKRWIAAVGLAWLAVLVTVGKRAWLEIDRLTYRGARW